jgi:hypothetical protein
MQGYDRICPRAQKAQLSTPPQAPNKVVSKLACTLPHFKTHGLFNINFPHKFCKKVATYKMVTEHGAMNGPPFQTGGCTFSSFKNKTKQGVHHTLALPFTLKSILRQKKN